ncbi:hypothetical protein DID77_04380, partial [Candidatus Marinamargulisbacteria bacterium SCGC AG-439-L15]
RFCSTVYLALDNDKAGQAATEKSYDVLKQYDFTVKVIQLNKKDPADFLLTTGTEAFQKELDANNTILEFKLKQLTENVDISQAETASKIVHAFTPYLKAEKDMIIYHHYITQLAKKLDIDRELIISKINREAPRYSKKRRFKPIRVSTKFQKSEDYLLYIAATRPDLRPLMQSAWDQNYFITPDKESLFKQVLNSSMINQELINTIPDTSKRQELSQLLIKVDTLLGDSDLSKEWQICLQNLKDYQENIRIDEIKNQLRKTQDLDEETETNLLKELSKLISKTT